MALELNKLAISTVGDSVPNPELQVNLFFVTQEAETFLVTSDAELAYSAWQKLPRNKETMLEDRKTGVVCSTERSEDNKHWMTIDDFERFIRRAG